MACSLSRQQEDPASGGRRNAVLEMPLGGATLAAAVHEKLRDDILKGPLAPGERLRLADLSARYGVGNTPLREALSRLASEGLVTSEGNKGFRVAPISLESLIDLSRARQIIEAEAFRLAIQRGDDAWEGEIVGWFHRLARVTSDNDMPAPSDIARADVERWERLHKGFHKALLSACGVVTILEIADRLYDLAARYRFLMLKVDPLGRGLVDEHRQLMNAALERNAADGEELLRGHLYLTAEVIAEIWQDETDS